MKGWLACVALSVWAAQACAAGAQADVNWLKTVAFAGHQTEYSGTFVYQIGNRLETSLITHLVDADSEYEKLESMDGPKREIVRHHGRVWCYVNHKMVQLDNQQNVSAFPSLLSDEMAVLNGNYDIKDAGVGRVLNYNAQILLLQPRDNLRYAHKLWVHGDTGLLLKAAVLDDKKQVVEQYAFTQLKIGGDLDRSLIALNKLQVPKNLSTGKSEANVPPPFNSGWVVDALPPGFKKLKEVLRPMHGKHAPVIQMVFSDGLSAISVFIEPADADEDDLEGFFGRGAVNLYHKVVDKHLYTVVGEVPPRTVMQVLDSIRYNGE